jgi:hypothetical protein
MAVGAQKASLSELPIGNISSLGAVHLKDYGHAATLRDLGPFYQYHV